MPCPILVYEGSAQGQWENGKERAVIDRGKSIFGSKRIRRRFGRLIKPRSSQRVCKILHRWAVWKPEKAYKKIEWKCLIDRDVLEWCRAITVLRCEVLHSVVIMTAQVGTRSDIGWAFVPIKCKHDLLTPCQIESYSSIALRLSNACKRNQRNEVENRRCLGSVDIDGWHFQKLGVFLVFRVMDYWHYKRSWSENVKWE